MILKKEKRVFCGLFIYISDVVGEQKSGSGGFGVDISESGSRSGF